MHLVQYPSVFLVAEVSNDLLVRPIRTEVIQFLAINSLVVSIIACLIAWFVSKKTTRPLKQLADLVDGVTPEHLPNKFAHHFPNNEVGILAKTLEKSLSRTSNAFAREKSFTRDVSHELRTPLAVMKNAVELSQSQQPTADKAVLERIYDAADQMEKTVHTLLMLAREEHAGIKNNPTKLMPLVETSILDNRFLLQDKPIDIDLCDSCNVTIKANENALKVLLDNILSNAFKYTESGTVKITYAQHKLIIQDTGPGIEPGISENVTELGVKGQQSTGFGFGLSIVRRLCEHQGWHMQVTSNKGTTVAVSFQK
jgi:signal transduction histidine kinase